MLPLKVSFHQMPSPTIFAASLDPAVRREHILLRMTLPVGEIHSPIKDPLTSHSDSEPSPPPLWYTQMSKRATVVHLSIEQITASKDGNIPRLPHEHSKGLKKSQDLQAIINGEKKKVIPIEESQAELTRREVDDYVGVYPSISRLGRISSTLPKRQVSQPTLSSSVVESVLPPEMKRPLATSINFKSDVDDHAGLCSLPGSAMESPHLLSPVNEVREPEEEGGKQNLIHGSHNLEVELINRPENRSF
ncbi:hypothetical protein PtA15_6A480 [Puccinia triticina]|uniref:Uncharacterized protein n=1 Tax=Puccinia triticina TaxID=208348 RepID=A0ABY7CKU6_9BASI|nr:uncharacterized protein PtA15_6A480 [Puccinia triticina]WAQ85851.1 hypothetical protein PtA15_6A480 [Puccinia triticina]